MKLCIIGSTGHINYVFESLDKCSDVELVGIAPGSKGESIEKAADIAVKKGCSFDRFDNYIDMLDSVKPDVAAVACHYSDHAKVTCDVLEHRISVFVEKPIATDLQDFIMLKDRFDKAKENDVHLCAMLGIRYNPCFLTAWKAVREGKIGVVRLMNAQKSYKLKNRKKFFKKRSTYGGTIPWVGSHAIDWLYWFSGESFQSVYASHSTMYNKNHGDLEVSALCHFTFSNEVYGSVNIDYLRPESAPTHGDDRLRIAGTEGIIEVRENRVFLVNNEKEEMQEVPVLPKRYFFADFINQIKGKGKCLVSAEDSFAVTKACLKARQSADENRLVYF